MAYTAQQEQIIRDKFLGLAEYLNERSRRIWAALEARALGFGGVAMVARATGIHRDTVTAGLARRAQTARGRAPRPYSETWRRTAPSHGKRSDVTERS